MNGIKKGFYYSLNKAQTKYSKNPRLQARRRALFFGAPVFIILFVATVIGLAMVTYNDKASPATYLSGTDVSGQMAAAIKTTAQNSLDNIKVTLKNDGKTVEASAKDLGMTLNEDATVDAVLNAGKDLNIFMRFNPFYRKDVGLKVDYNVVALQSYLNEHFKEITTPATNATIVYNETSAQFDVVKGKAGVEVDAKKLEDSIDQALQTTTDMTFDVEATQAEPKVGQAAAEEARDYMNKRIDLKMNLNHQGQLLYFIDPPDIAEWADILPNNDTGKINIIFDKSRIKLFLQNKVAPNIASAPVDKKIFVDTNGKEIAVIQQGQKGKEPRDFDVLVDKVYDAVEKGHDLNQELDLVEKDFKTETVKIDGSRWLEVNIGQQTATLWAGKDKVATYPVSTGAQYSPTPTGWFTILRKVANETMKGPAQDNDGDGRTDGPLDYPAYNLPNVLWTSYFTGSGVAFHTNYWAVGNPFGNYGTSHGCVGMREADAKAVYDFAPVGTPVWVH